MKKAYVSNEVIASCSDCGYEENYEMTCDKCNSSLTESDEIYCDNETGDHYCYGCGEDLIEEGKEK